MASKGRDVMLSDERISEIADKYYAPVGNTKHIEQAIRDALSELAVRDSRIAELVPVMGPAVAEKFAIYFSGNDRHPSAFMDHWQLFDSAESTQRVINAAASENVRDLYIVRKVFIYADAPQTSITAAELEAKDAERYRWLRMQTWYQSGIAVVSNPKEAVKIGYDCPSYARLDDIIDAAIAKERNHG
jgi:hypothetical protein